MNANPLDGAVPGSSSLDRRGRRGVIVGSILVYILLFPTTYRFITHFYFILGLVPIIAAGLLLGFRAAIVTVFGISVVHFGVLAGPLGVPPGEAFVESVPFVSLLIGGVVGHLRDLRVEVARQRDELKRQNERLNEFASVLSHDLRGPLTVAQGRLDLARKELDTEHFEAIDGALRRMDSMIGDLLTLAREGQSVSDREPTDLSVVVTESWANVDTKDATLGNGVDRTVKADVGRLKQVFENLFRNAVEHGGDDVTVTVGELEDGFYVEDDGSGIPEDDRDRLFEAGYSTTPGGTGLGLSIIGAIVEAHDWEIGVTDGTEGGTRFEITGVAFVDG